MERRDCDRAFIAVLEAGSFARAAQHLGISAGQASKLVSKLEQDLGVQLLNRTTRALAPTEVGLGYFERIKPLLDEFDALDAAVRHASGAATGRLRLSVPVSFGTEQLMPVLTGFAQAFPEIHLDIRFSDRVVAVVDEGFDIAVRIGNPADSSLIARKLCDVRVVIVASPAYIASHGEPATPAELARHACIIDTNFQEPLVWRFRVPGALESTSVAVTGRLQFSNAHACLTAAQAGLGIARVPSFLAGPALRCGAVRPLLRDFEDRPMGVYVLYPPARHLALKVRVLVDYLAERYRGEPPWDHGW
jgi:DNA-binding transcriptional LysR family regulator